MKVGIMLWDTDFVARMWRRGGCCSVTGSFRTFLNTCEVFKNTRKLHGSEIGIEYDYSAEVNRTRKENDYVFSGYEKEWAESCFKKRSLNCGWWLYNLNDLKLNTLIEVARKRMFKLASHLRLFDYGQHVWYLKRPG
jgi:hypothetical protein